MEEGGRERKRRVEVGQYYRNNAELRLVHVLLLREHAEINN